MTDMKLFSKNFNQIKVKGNTNAESSSYEELSF